MDIYPVIVSFYTKNTLYEEQVQRLMASCDKLKLEFHVVGIESFGSWELNCAYKPFFLLECLKTLRKPILWVDADGEVVRRPLKKDLQGDIAAYCAEELPWTHISKVRSGTVFIDATDGGERALRLWAEEMTAMFSNPTGDEPLIDQIALRKGLQEPKDFQVGQLPLSYVKIFDHPGDSQKVIRPFIVHYQASRLFKTFEEKSLSRLR